ncbi:MAG: FAD-binding oxidoreductase [Pseudomonadota bacterium]
MPMITNQSPIAFSDPLPDEVDVVVIGAGVAGTATAFFLAEKGVKVLLCEKGRVAGEQSSRNWGWIRQQGRDWRELPIMMESNKIWRGLAERTGEADLTFTQSGSLHLIEDEEKLQKFEEWFDIAKEHQLDTRMLTKDEIAAKYPNIRGNFIAGLETESDGRGEPFVAIPALARAAQRLGVSVIEGCAVRTLDIQGGRIAGVVTEKGRVKCAQAVLAGGAWSTYFAANTGVNLPQLTVRSTVARTTPLPEHYVRNTNTPGLALRRRADGGYTIASMDLAEHYVSKASFKYFLKFINLLRVSAKDVRLKIGPPKGYPGAWGSPSRWTAEQESPFERMRVLNPDPSPISLQRIRDRLPSRYPDIKEAGFAETWAGMIDVTPDAVPTLGPVDEVEGLHIATGLSGHGFGIGPAIGRIMSDIVTGKPTGHEVGHFRNRRFFDGSEIVPGPY